MLLQGVGVVREKLTVRVCLALSFQEKFVGGLGVTETLTVASLLGHHSQVILSGNHRHRVR